MSTITLGGEEHLMVMGHAVNIAARLQNATKALNNNFLVSASAMDLSRKEIESPTSKIDLKGIGSGFEVRMLGESYA